MALLGDRVVAVSNASGLVVNGILLLEPASGAPPVPAGGGVLDVSSSPWERRRSPAPAPTTRFPAAAHRPAGRGSRFVLLDQLPGPPADQQGDRQADHKRHDEADPGHPGQPFLGRLAQEPDEVGEAAAQ